MPAAATKAPRNTPGTRPRSKVGGLSGANRIFWSRGSWLMIFSADEDVTMMSECAFTAAEQLM